MRRTRYDPAALRAAWWAWRSAGRVQRSLRKLGLDGSVRVPRPPSATSNARRGVMAALTRRGSACLVSSIVLQRWDSAHGRPREVVIGVAGIEEFEAHAWLDGDPGQHHAGFVEIRRLQGQA